MRINILELFIDATFDINTSSIHHNGHLQGRQVGGAPTRIHLALPCIQTMQQLYYSFQQNIHCYQGPLDDIDGSLVKENETLKRTSKEMMVDYVHGQNHLLHPSQLVHCYQVLPRSDPTDDSTILPITIIWLNIHHC